MPGCKISLKQKESYMKHRSNHLSQETNALKSGISVRRGRNLEKQEIPLQQKKTPLRL